jgi:hypothetical protein
MPIRHLFLKKYVFYLLVRNSVQEGPEATRKEQKRVSMMLYAIKIIFLVLTIPTLHLREYKKKKKKEVV